MVRTIRLMDEDDLYFFNRVRNSSVEYLHSQDTHTLEECKEWFDKQTDPYYIMEVNGIPVGYIRTSMWWWGRESEVYVGMDIAPEHRGKGYSIPFYEDFFHGLKTFGHIKRVKLYVRKDNERAIHIYKKLGFKIINKNGLVVHGHPSYQMMKTL